MLWAGVVEEGSSLFSRLMIGKKSNESVGIKTGSAHVNIAVNAAEVFFFVMFFTKRLLLGVSVRSLNADLEDILLRSCDFSGVAFEAFERHLLFLCSVH